MSAPVINLTTSVLGYQQWQQWTYQPWATDLMATTKPITGITVVSSKSTVACTSHGLSAGQPFVMPTLVNPSGLVAGQVYYVVTPSSNTFTFTASPGGAELASGTADSGTLYGGDRWTSSPVPPGLTFNAATGAISGAGTVSGVYIVGLQVTNGNGTSTVVNLTIGIEPAAYSNHSGVDLEIDVGTGDVTVDPKAVLKEDDDLLFYITFARNGSPLDLGTLTGMNLSVKEFEPGASLLIGNTFGKTGSGSNAIYILYAKLESAALQGTMSNYEADAGTNFSPVLELEWIEPNTTSVGPSTLRRSSGLFTIPIFRNVLPD